MSGSSDALATVTLRVNRFTPRPERDRPARSGSPFAKKSSPFGGASASARRRPRGKQWVQEYTLPVRREDTVLVSVMLVNNETGARFPLEEIIPAVRRAAPHALIHCDAVQAAGKLPIRVESLDVDLLTVSGHKLHAPKGCGALYIKKGIRLLPRALGGEQEKKRRAGTEAMPLIAAFGAAIQALPDLREQDAHFRRLLRRLLDGLACRDEVILHRPANAVPYIVNLSVPGLRSETVLHFLSERGVMVSSGSACAKGAKSPVLTALGLPAREIDSALRISFCRDNTEEDIDRLLAGLQEAWNTLAHVR